jgi:predicted dehydrogenase
LATITCCQTSYDVKEAVVHGSKGKLELHDPWYKPTAMTLHVEGQQPDRIEMPLGRYNGYEYEACAVMDCIVVGQTECAAMPLDQTLAIMKIMDGLCQQGGFRYPTE